MFKSSTKEEDVKVLINSVKKEFQQEITSLNERMIEMEKRNQYLEKQNLNLNTFIQHHFERLERKTDENHKYILNTWNPFMQSTIEGVKNDLIQAMDTNKKDDNELSKRVDTLAIQVSNLNKMIIDKDPSLGRVLVGNCSNIRKIFIGRVLVGTCINSKKIFVNKNINTFDQIMGIFYSTSTNIDVHVPVFLLESLSKFKNIKIFNLMCITTFNYDIMYNNKLLYNRKNNGKQKTPYDDEKTKNIIKNYCKTLNIEFICK
jgi:hypothetical protein